MSLLEKLFGEQDSWAASTIRNEQYCQFIEDLAVELSWHGGASDAELALFGSGTEGSAGKRGRDLVEPPRKAKRTNRS